MKATLAWGFCAVPAGGFIAASVAFLLLAVPEYGLWRLTGFPNRFWVDVSDKSACLALFCLICCGTMRAFYHHCFARWGLRWCVWFSIATIVICLLTPALAIAD